MKTVKDIGQVQLTQSFRTITIGKFDGLHLGHRELVEKTVQIAQEHQGESLVLTFDPHPITILKPESQFFRLFDHQDQSEVLEQLGVNWFVIENFTKEFSSLEPAAFLKKLIFDPIRPNVIVVGYDFAFGQNKGGDVKFLREYAKKYDCEVVVLNPVRDENQIVSSSLIRDLISKGDVGRANRLLARPYFIRGPVVKGDQRGRKIGFSTANLQVGIDVNPRTGVYVSRTWMGGRFFRSVSNLGTRPTFTKKDDGVIQCFLETHIFDFDSEIYGEMIRVELLGFLRDERKFKNAEELIAQIEVDCLQSRRIHDEMVGAR